MDNLDELDIPFEEDLNRNQFALKSWLRYLDHKRNAPPAQRIFLYERAVRQLPGSYKLWKAYLDFRLGLVLGRDEDGETGLRQLLVPLSDRAAWDELNSCFERSLVLLNKMPVIWSMYCTALEHQDRPTLTRRTFDRALRALPLTQHERVWHRYLAFARRVGGETAVRVWRRYLKYDSQGAEDFIQLLLGLEPPRFAEAARYLASIVEDPKFKSKHGKSQFQLWSELCDLLCDHPDEVEEPTSTDNMVVVRSTAGNDRPGRVEKLDVEKILRSGITRFSDQVGKLWNTLAKWFVLKGEFERARDVYEEGMRKVATVRDFSMIFDAYAEFEESIISNTMSSDDPPEEDQEVIAALPPMDLDISFADLALDLKIARLDRLIERRPFLVNDVLLRQNPNNVAEWSNRIELFKKTGDGRKVVDAFEKALSSINPRKAVGNLHDLWIGFAKWHEGNGDLHGARAVFERAVKVPFRKPDDLADVWIAWSQMELDHDDLKRALELLGRATAPPAKHNLGVRYDDDTVPAQVRLFKSLRLWNHFVDLEESVGTVESTRAVYDRIIDLKVANIQTVINYASFLLDNSYFEDAFRVYERGIEVFKYPMAFEIWNIYLAKFVSHYGASKLERARDLFEQALVDVPEKHAKAIYLAYAKLEEDFGLAKHAMRIYDRATRAVGDEDRFSTFEIYIAKATQYFGLVSTREIYSKALEMLPDKKARDMSLRFSDMETKLGEIDRARAILAYASQFSDPRVDPDFWKHWHDFEIKHGNEDTFKEHLRIRRSVQAKFNTEVSFISAQMLAAKQNRANGQQEPEPLQSAQDQMALLEAEAQRQQAQSKPSLQFVKATVTAPKEPSNVPSRARPCTQPRRNRYRGRRGARSRGR
ncbi:hypothetical protein DFJ74DRAFT_435548 [Hyaloraphidium curvatum]|nr:hypothetical protein DFJ74DRAFT_435548 [Hyaloraphidium curvatum]